MNKTRAGRYIRCIGNNREAVRLRDINELLMDTGLGRDGYSIIGQGRIAEIVSAVLCAIFLRKIYRKTIKPLYN